ncbi:MAG TPA: hydrolase [Thermoanaerobaculia bacterium]|nr:hydrolase [Thermoanaerobaculia bacterium]
MRLDRNQTVLVVIDVQEKLIPVIDGAADVVRNLERLIRGCHILGVPLLVTEQYVKGLGPTVEPLRRALEETSGYEPIEKSCFSAYGCDAFSTRLAALGRMQVLVAGVETHVCVYQTVEDLLARDLSVSVIADAVSSRTPRNRELALQRLVSDGASLSSTEMALFELTVAASSDEFRAISRLVK